MTGEDAVGLAFPLDWTTSERPINNGLFGIWLIDANGKKICPVWGGKHQAERADFIRDACNEKARAWALFGHNTLILQYLFNANHLNVRLFSGHGC